MKGAVHLFLRQLNSSLRQFLDYSVFLQTVLQDERQSQALTLKVSTDCWLILWWTLVW